MKVVRDEYNDFNPRDWDNLGTMFCVHGRYRLGDVGAEDIRDEKGSFKKDYIVLPLYLLDHSGLRISTESFGCPWDSGMIGYVYVSKEKVRKELGVKRITHDVTNRVIDLLKSEVSDYDSYLTGDIYIVYSDEEDLNDYETVYGYKNLTEEQQYAYENNVSFSMNFTITPKEYEELVKIGDETNNNIINRIIDYYSHTKPRG